MVGIVLHGLVFSTLAMVGEIFDGTAGRRTGMVVLVTIVVLVVNIALLVDAYIFLTATN